MSRYVPTFVRERYGSCPHRPQGLIFSMQKCCMQSVHVSTDMADPVGDETKSSSIMFVNLSGNGPKRGNPNDAGLPEAPEALFLINSLYEIDGFKASSASSSASISWGVAP